MSEPTDAPMLASRVVAERTHLVVPSLPNWIEPTVEYLRHKAVQCGACQPTRAGKLLVTLHEAITNAIVHGNLEISSELKEQGDSVFAEALARRSADADYSDRVVDIVVDFDGEKCRWVITDEGKGFDVERVLARVLSDDPEILLASGRGILMMKSFLDDVHFALGGRRVILTLARDSGAERRKDHRAPIIQPFQITPIGPDGDPQWHSTYEAVSRNLSENGIALLQQQLASSGKLLIGIPTATGIVQLSAEVKHSRPLGAHGMELGCQFSSQSTLLPSSADVGPESAGSINDLSEVHGRMLAILDAHQSGKVPGDERRQHPRVVFNERVLLQMPGRPDSIIGYARDLSKGGMALITQEPVPGEIVIAFSAVGTREAFKVKSRVVRCSLIQEGFYDVGAAFLRIATLEH